MLIAIGPAGVARASCGEAGLFEARGAANFSTYGTWAFVGNYQNAVNQFCGGDGMASTQLIQFNTGATDWIEGGLYRQNLNGATATFTWWEYGIYPNWDAAS
jgi:hypothetical protein